MNIWERMRPPDKIRNIREEALRKASKSSQKIAYKGRLVTAKKREKRRVEAVYKVLKKHLERSIRILNAYYIAEPFYRDLIKLRFSEEKLRKSLKRLLGSRRVLERLREEYLEKIDAIKNTEDGKMIRKQALGRLLSILERQKKQIQLSREIWKYAHKLPSVNFEEPIVVISGAPNVGKSSLINKLSNAKLSVASYPFTTKEIHLGHLQTRFSRIQFIDTPGLLDRPFKERNDIEMQAIYALKHLPHLIIFMLDPTFESYYEPEKQISIFKEVVGLFEDKPYLIVVNKIDEEHVDFHTYLKNQHIIKISILEDKGIDILKREMLNKLKIEA